MRNQTSTRARRKLIGYDTLTECVARVRVGIPLALVIRQLDLPISRPVAAALVGYFKEARGADSVTVRDAIDKSLFPSWMKADSGVAESPKGLAYHGTFPYGAWEDAQ